MSRLLPALLAAAMLAACTSPESTRTRGGGPGADMGNRGDRVRMHEGSRPYAGTPQLAGIDAPPLDPAEHAWSLSRP